MLSANHPLLKVNPVIQFCIAFFIGAIGIILAKMQLLTMSNDWNAVCTAVLLYICMNAILGLFQDNPFKYIGLSILMYVVLIVVFLFLGKYNWMDSIRTTTSQQLVILASTIFYIVISVITQFIRLIYINTQHL
jgi:hypothetical protein